MLWLHGSVTDVAPLSRLLSVFGCETKKATVNQSYCVGAGEENNENKGRGNGEKKAIQRHEKAQSPCWLIK